MSPFRICQASVLEFSPDLPTAEFFRSDPVAGHARIASPLGGVRRCRCSDVAVVCPSVLVNSEREEGRLLKFHYLPYKSTHSAQSPELACDYEKII